MSSKKWIWAVVVVLIILLGLWYFGAFNSTPAPAQSAAVNIATTNSAAAAQNTLIKTDVSMLDKQIAITNASIAAVTGAPTKPQIATIGVNFNTEVTTYGRLITEINSAIINAKSTGTPTAAAVAAMSDLSNQLANLTSQAGTAVKNTAASGSTAATVAASLKQMQSAQTYDAAARADIQTVITTLGIK